MKYLILCAALLFGSSMLAQQETHPPIGPLPQQQGPPLEPGNRTPGTMPPDSRAPEQPVLPNAEAQQQIQSRIADEPMLAGTNLNVSVDDHGVVLSGTVDTQEQHDAAVRIAHSYAGDRPINDKIQIRGKA